MTTPNGMYDMTGWAGVSCRVADLIHRGGAALSVASTLTDPHGTYGSPIVFTEWWWMEEPVLRTYRRPGGECTHFVAEHPSAARRDEDDE